MRTKARTPKRTIVFYSRLTIWLALLFIAGGLSFQSIQVNLFTQSDVDRAFADAMAELDGVDGVQVHRSYWVARKAVEGAVRRNGRHYVTLIDGSEVPVSRSYRRNAESAGLI